MADLCIQDLTRLTRMPDIDGPGERIAGQLWYDVNFSGGTISGVSISDIDLDGAVITNSTINSTTIGAITPDSGAFTTLSASGQITSTVSTGTAPLVVASTTRVSNLNVAQAGLADTVTVADAAGDTTCFVLLAGSATGNLPVLSDTGITYDSSTNALTATSFVGALTGNATTATTLQTSRNFSINGSTGLTASAVGFNGSGNVSLSLTGTLEVDNGGTGLTAVGTSGNLLTSNGSAWVSSAPSFSDALFRVTDNGDPTKQLAFEVSGVSAGTTRTLTVPNANTTIVGTDVSQTLTLKTLTSPDINGGTVDSLTSLSVRSTGSGAFDLTVANTENLTAGRTITITVNDANRLLSLAADLVYVGWTSYTPTYNGLGTVSPSAVYYKRVGDGLFLRGRFTAGTVAAAEMRIGLPSGFTSTANITTLELCGSIGVNAAFESAFVGIEPSTAYVVVTRPSTNAFTKINGNTFANNAVFSFFAHVPL